MKQRMKDDPDYQIDYDRCIFYNEFQRIQHRMNLVKPDLEQFWTVTIDPKLTQKVLKMIKSEFKNTLESLKHLKRIRRVETDTNFKLEVIICPKTDLTCQTLRNDLVQKFRPDDFSISTAFIPINKPYDKDTNMEWSKEYWPLVWKGNPMVQELRESYDTFDKDTIYNYLSAIAKIASQKEDKLSVATIFVDPATNMIMASNIDARNDKDPMNHSIIQCINDIAKVELERRSSDHTSNKYLCLNYDVYTTHEPCTMCAMALLHSRIRRVVYIKPSPVTGAFGISSRCGYMIHLSCKLNWKFECFQYLGDKFQIPELDSSINV